MSLVKQLQQHTLKKSHRLDPNAISETELNIIQNILFSSRDRAVYLLVTTAVGFAFISYCSAKFTFVKSSRMALTAETLVYLETGKGLKQTLKVREAHSVMKICFTIWKQYATGPADCPAVSVRIQHLFLVFGLAIYGTLWP